MACEACRIGLPGRCPTCTSENFATTKRCAVIGCVLPFGHFDRSEYSEHLTAREAEGYQTECQDGWHQAVAYALGRQGVR